MTWNALIAASTFTILVWAQATISQGQNWINLPFFLCLPTPSELQEAQHCIDVGFMDLEQFGKIFDELDKDRIKEVALPPRQVIHFFFVHSFYSWYVLLIWPYLSVFPAQHPPPPQYNSPVLQRVQQIFSHYYFTILGNAVALANVMCICVGWARTHTDARTLLWKQKCDQSRMLMDLSLRTVFHTYDFSFI